MEIPPRWISGAEKKKEYVEHYVQHLLHLREEKMEMTGLCLLAQA